MQNIDKQLSEPVSRLVMYFGGQVKAAKALGVKQGTVSGWLTGKHGVSEFNALKAERATYGAVKAHELCPSLIEIYGDREKCE